MAAHGNRVRIIAGRHRGRHLHFLPGAGLRPTPDRVRETLFNWLRGNLDGARCLDLCAGSGALGLEALSRGAAFLCAVESNRRAARRLEQNQALLREPGVEIRHADALRFLRGRPVRPFDIVFLDPPFASDLLAPACRLLEGNDWLAADAWLYLEQDARRAWPELPANWHVRREGAAGQSAHRLVWRNGCG